jgi:hypothetical protein
MEQHDFQPANSSNNSSDPSNTIRELLTDELELFRNLFRETNQFVNHMDSLSVESVMNLLNSRQEWIEELLLLEKKRKLAGSVNDQKIIKEITAIANSLIEIDVKLLDLLRNKKQEIIKDLSKITDKRSKNRKGRTLRYNNSSIIDIIQE